MKIHDCQQGSSEWFKIRAGLPTASNFDRIITPTGKDSEQRHKYRYRLLAERILGKPLEENPFQSKWMERGQALEPEAVQYYELLNDVETVKVGFVTNDAGTIGASPDRRVGESGWLEIKTPSPDEHMAYLMQSGGIYKEYKTQVQGQLYVFEADWEDTLSYYPGLPEALYRVGRDEEFIGKLDTALRRFNDELEEDWEFCVKRGWTTLESLPKRETLLHIDALVQSLSERGIPAPEWT